jgi:hypothetical protein
MLWLNPCHWTWQRKKEKVAKIFGDDKFEPPQKNWPLLRFFVGCEFSHNGDKKNWNEYGIFFLVL